jgi:hypothetical protein
LLKRDHTSSISQIPKGLAAAAIRPTATGSICHRGQRRSLSAGDTLATPFRIRFVTVYHKTMGYSSGLRLKRRVEVFYLNEKPSIYTK